MRQHPAERGRAYVARVHAWCLGLAGLVAAFSGFFGGGVWGWESAVAAFAGGTAAVLPRMLAARGLLKRYRATEAGGFYLALWLYQGLKWLLTAALLLVALRELKGHEHFVLIGFLLTLQGVWIVPLLLNGLDLKEKGSHER